jgi:predicted phosphodiesterase
VERISKQIDKPEIHFYPIGDVHYKESGCAWRQFKDKVQEVKEDKIGYVIGMGDWLSCITPKDKRFDPTYPYLPLDEAIKDMIAVLLPIKKKIICILEGNHEYKITKEGVGSPDKRIAEALGSFYMGFSGFIRIASNRKGYAKVLNIYAHHGWFSGRKRGSKVNAIEEITMGYEADLYICGHAHDSFNTDRVRIDYFGLKEKKYVLSGSYLKTAEWGTMSYSEQKGYPPQKIGSPMIKWEPFAERRFNGDKIRGKITVT